MQCWTNLPSQPALACPTMRVYLCKLEPHMLGAYLAMQGAYAILQADRSASNASGMRLL